MNCCCWSVVLPASLATGGSEKVLAGAEVAPLCVKEEEETSTIQKSI